MAKNTALTTAFKETQVLQVISMILDGRTQTQACKAVGISPSTYRRYIQEHPDTIEVVRELIISTEKANLAEIVSARTALVTRMIGEAAKTQDITEMIAVDKHLGVLQGELEDRVGVSAKGDDVAEDFLGDPDFQPVESRFTPVDTVNLKPRSDGSVDVTMKQKAKVIDAESEDAD